MKQILKSEWDEVANSMQLCELPFSVEEIESKFSLSFFEYQEQGLGDCYGAYIHHGTSKYFLMGHADKTNKTPGVTVFIRSFEKNPKQSLANIYDGFQIDQSLLNWKLEDTSPPNWGVFRLDDNNNEVEMYRFQDIETANLIVAKFEQKNHKQTYSVKKIQN